MVIKLILHHDGVAVRVIKNMRDRECFWWEDRCECDLKSGGYAIGWFGAIYRSLATFALAVRIETLEESEEEEEYIYVMLYSILLTYYFISLAANFLLIVGINKKQSNYILPYLGIHGVEILSLVACLFGGIVLIVKIPCVEILYYFIPCGFLVIGAYTYFWSLLLRLFHDFKQTSDENTSTTFQLSDCGYVRCRCICFKSKSLDIVTYQ